MLVCGIGAPKALRAAIIRRLAVCGLLLVLIWIFRSRPLPGHREVASRFVKDFIVRFRKGDHA